MAEENADLRTRVVTLEHGQTAIQQRVSDLEKYRQSNEIADAKMETRVEAMNEKLSAISSNTTWIIRLVIGGFLMAIIAFIVSGGLKAI
ncbi:hemolysin XhlA family protein [Brucella intermedia]|uniref:hemolysin XhlA family protein n=1 Tax=Brucella intermedia TaxID=94625 RepID=UPI001879FAE0|nr:hemolysin XhlA family protein [Brucella intermedia]